MNVLFQLLTYFYLITLDFLIINYKVEKVPNDWVIGEILPIYKNKRDVKSPGNYRGITILSCFGKFFTSLLHQRLEKFLETHNILNENQTGFRKTYSTVDNVFIMKCLIDMFFSKKKKLFCALLITRRRLTQYGGLDYGPSSLQVVDQEKFLKW